MIADDGLKLCLSGLVLGTCGALGLGLAGSRRLFGLTPTNHGPSLRRRDSCSHGVVPLLRPRATTAVPALSNRSE